MSKLYVGRISERTRERDLEDLFSKFGKITCIELKLGYAFVEFEDRRDAEDALKEVHGTDFLEHRITVEFSYSSQGYPSRKKSYPGDGRCYNCGSEGHWLNQSSSLILNKHNINLNINTNTGHENVQNHKVEDEMAEITVSLCLVFLEF